MGKQIEFFNEPPRALRSLRKEMSLVKLAKMTGISHSHLSRIFSGKRSMSLIVARTIATALSCSVEELVGVIAEHEGAADPRTRFKAA